MQPLLACKEELTKAAPRSDGEQTTRCVLVFWCTGIHMQAAAAPAEQAEFQASKRALARKKAAAEIYMERLSTSPSRCAAIYDCGVASPGWRRAVCFEGIERRSLACMLHLRPVHVSTSGRQELCPSKRSLTRASRESKRTSAVSKQDTAKCLQTSVPTTGWNRMVVPSSAECQAKSHKWSAHLCPCALMVSSCFRC